MDHNLSKNQECSLETLVLVSSRLEDMKNGLGLDLDLEESLDIFKTLMNDNTNLISWRVLVLFPLCVH